MKKYFLSVVVLLIVTVFGWELMIARPAYPVNLDPATRADLIIKLRQLQPDLQPGRDGTGSPVLYALSSSPGGLPDSVLVNGRVQGGPARIFLYPLRWPEGKIYPALPSKDMGITSGTWDQGLFVKAPYVFYFSCQASQIQTLNVWNLASGKRQQFVFSAPPSSASISDCTGSGNDLIVACSVSGKRQNIDLHLAAGEVDASSKELQLNTAGGNSDTAFIRLVEWARDNVGSSVVACIENTFYRGNDYLTYLIYHLSHSDQSPVIAKSQAQQPAKVNGLQWTALVSSPKGRPALESSELYPDPTGPMPR